MAFIRFGRIDSSLISIFLGCVFSILSRLVMKDKNTILFKQKIFPNLLASVVKLFTIIPLLIFIFRSKNVNNNTNNANYTQNFPSNNSLELIYSENNEDYDIKGKYRYIIISATIVFIQGIILLYAIGVKSNSWIWDIVITSILYYLIFKIKLYKHHYLCMIFIILTGFIIDISSNNLQKDVSNHLLFLFLRFIREILYSLVNVINKYSMEKKYVSVYELSLYTGIIDSILFGLLQIIDYYCNLKIDNLDEYFSTFSATEILVILGLLVTQLGLYLCTLITNKNFTPCHVFTIVVFGQLANYMDFSAVSIILIICYIFIFFISLIFNEIIEINVWGLSDNTKRNITRRAESENQTIEKNNTMSSIEELNRDTLIELEKQDSFRDSL